MIAGGPPCQPFSRAGKREAVKTDTGKLFKDFVRLVDEVRPRWFLFENVKGLILTKAPVARLQCRSCRERMLVNFDDWEALQKEEGMSVSCYRCSSADTVVTWANEAGGSLDIILQEFAKLGYRSFHKILNAADFGAPQMRERLFIVGSRDGESFQWPTPTHGKVSDNLELFDVNSIQPWLGMNQVLWANGHWRYGKLGRDAVLWVTRRVSLPDKGDANEAMRLVIAGYQKVLDERRAKALAISNGRPVELRSGWLLYESSLSEFLYWEEPTVNLNPTEHKAVWKERVARGEGGRRGNKNLWIYNKATGRKVWSVTGGGSGTKIQPYFTVPTADDENLCYFRVQGEMLAGDTVRVWITEPTARTLKGILGDLDPERLSDAILKAAATAPSLAATEDHERVQELVILHAAYIALKEKFPGVSDEHCFQLLCKRLAEARS